MTRVRIWPLLILFLCLSVVPYAFCQEPNIANFRTNLSVSDINFNEGKLTLYGLYLRVDTTEKFGVLVFSPAMYSPNLWEEWSEYEDGRFYLNNIFYGDGIEVRFNLDEFVFLNDRIKFGIVLGLNITTQEIPQKVNADLNVHLREEWTIMGILKKVPAEEASRHTPMGMWAINSSIQHYSIKDFYVLEVQISRMLNMRNAFLWLPPIFMLALIIVSILLVYKKDLPNTLRVYLTVAFFSFGYLLLLREITPPTMTSIENFTLVDTFFCIVITIIAIPWSIIKKRDEDNKKHIGS